MRLTTRGRYAVTAMLDLAFHREEGPVTLADISRRQAISLSYLEQLFSRLRRKGLVESTRGPGGGYRLGRALEDIAVAEIIDAVDESVDTTRRAGRGNCQADQRCLTHELWCELSEHIHRFLNGVSLATLVARDAVKEVAERQDRGAVVPCGPQKMRRSGTAVTFDMPS